MITKQSNIDQIVISENECISFRTVTRIVEDGEVISQSYHRGSASPGDDVSALPEKIVAICNLIWTDEVVTAFKQSVPALKPDE